MKAGKMKYPVRDFGLKLDTDGKTTTSIENGISTIAWDLPTVEGDVHRYEFKWTRL